MEEKIKEGNEILILKKKRRILSVVEYLCSYKYFPPKKISTISNTGFLIGKTKDPQVIVYFYNYLLHNHDKPCCYIMHWTFANQLFMPNSCIFF